MHPGFAHFPPVSFRNARLVPGGTLVRSLATANSTFPPRSETPFGSVISRKAFLHDGTNSNYELGTLACAAGSRSFTPPSATARTTDRTRSGRFVGFFRGFRRTGVVNTLEAAAHHRQMANALGRAIRVPGRWHGHPHVAVRDARRQISASR
jgi:hypothetical protein